VKKLGVVVNPVAGVGGRVGLKGSDGAEILRQALELGAVRDAPRRARLALERLSRLRDHIEIVTWPGEMGEEEARAAGFEPRVLGSLEGRRSYIECERERRAGAAPHMACADFVLTLPADTEQAARDLLAAGVDLILFAGGDGTARTICDAVGDCVPVIGVPAGVKIHSAVYATSPAAAGDVAALYLHDQPAAVRLREGEVMDIDEQAFREDRVSAQLYGFMTVPYARGLTQSAKAGGVAGEERALNDIATDVIRDMSPGVLYILGPGTTTRTIMSRLGMDKTLLGVDAVCDHASSRQRSHRERPPPAARGPRGRARRGHRDRRPGTHLRARQPADQPRGHPSRRARGDHRHRHADQAPVARGTAAARGHRRRRPRRRAERIRQGRHRSGRAHDVQSARLRQSPAGRHDGRVSSSQAWTHAPALLNAHTIAKPGRRDYCCDDGVSRRLRSDDGG